MQLLQVRCTRSSPLSQVSVLTLLQAPSTAGDPDVLIDTSHMLFRWSYFSRSFTYLPNLVFPGLPLAASFAYSCLPYPLFLLVSSDHF